MDECTTLRQKAESQLSHWAAITTCSSIYNISANFETKSNINFSRKGRQEFHLRTPRSPRHSGPTSEQTKELQRFRQSRTEKSERKEIEVPTAAELLDESAEDKWREREPNLTGLTSEYDLELFRSAQAEACSKLVLKLSLLIYINFIKTIIILR